MPRIKLTQIQKRKRAVIGGMFGLIVGGWMIFAMKDNLGFIIAGIGLILLIAWNK